MCLPHRNAPIIVATCCAIWVHSRFAAAGIEEDRQEYLQLIRQFIADFGAGHYVKAEEDAKQMVAIARRSFPDNPIVIAGSYQYLGSTYNNQGRYTEAEPAFRYALTTLERSGGPNQSSIAILLSPYGQCFWHQGRYFEAELMFRRGIAIEQLLNTNPAVLAELQHNMALVYVEQGKYAEAEPLHLQSLEIQKRVLGGEHPEVAVGLSSLANLYQMMGNGAKAEPLYRRALAIREKTLRPDHPDTAKSLNNLANVLVSQGNAAEAELLYRRTLAMRAKIRGESDIEVAAILGNLARLYQSQKRYAEAEPLADRAVEIAAVARGEPRLAFGCYRDRAMLRWDTGRQEEAIADLEAALQIAETMRAQVAGAEKERANFLELYNWAYETLTRWHLELGNLDKSLAAVERCRARTLVDQMNAQRVDLLASLPTAVAQQLRQRESAAQAAVAGLERQLELLSQRQGLSAEQRRTEENRLVTMFQQARQEQVEAYRDVRNASPAYRLMVGKNFEPVRLDQLHAWVEQEDAMLLQYFLGDENAYLLVIGGDQKSKLVELKLTATEAKALNTDIGPLTVGRAMSVMTLDGQELPRRIAAAQRDAAVTDRLAALWKALVPESVRAALLAGNYKRLIVIPDGPLVNLPFETLVVEPGEEPVYLLDRGPPIVAGPSATLLFNLSQRDTKREARKAGSPVLTVGNPSYGVSRATPQSTNPGSASELLASLQPGIRFASRGRLKSLPYTGNEVSWVAEMFGKIGYAADKLLQRDATEAKVRAAISGRQIVHLACHGLVDNEYGNFFGALALTPGPQGSANPADDGFLTLPEIYELNLKSCELAILSACQTNYGPQQRGEGAWALSRGFLVAGSRRVMASNWLVDDESAASLVSVCCSILAKHHQAGQPMDYAAALHEAKRWIRKHDKWKHPYYWGAFVLVGPN